MTTTNRNASEARLMAFTAEVQRAEHAGEIDAFNPHRPWGEAFRYAVEHACRTYETPEERSLVLSQWLESMMD